MISSNRNIVPLRIGIPLSLFFGLLIDFSNIFSLSTFLVILLVLSILLAIYYLFCYRLTIDKDLLIQEYPCSQKNKYFSIKDITEVRHHTSNKGIDYLVLKYKNEKRAFNIDHAFYKNLLNAVK
jgi:hypothetical protein